MTKRIISLVLCLAMIVGMMPSFTLNASAAETVLDAAIFCSDVHGSSSDLTSVMSGVKTSGQTYSAIGFVGDTCLTVAKTESAVNSGLGYTPTVMFSYASSHDTENSSDISTNWDYSGEVENVSDDYLVYTIRETDMKNDTDADEAFTTWYSGLTDAEKALPIFIMSHRPLHKRRGDNAGAAGWYTAISTAAKTSDIVFFWAHNHTGESSADEIAYYVPNDGTETITVEGGSTVGLNFTYMNAGYINANNQKPARLGVATTVQIYSDELVFQDYDENGKYTSSYSHNVTVTREHAAAAVTPSTLAVTGTTEYYVGDALKDPTEITVTYSDGTSETLSAADLTVACDGLTDGVFATAGTYTVTYTYTKDGYSASAELTVTVTAPTIQSIAVTTLPTKTIYGVGDELDTTGMVVTATYDNGTTAEITGWYTSAVDMTTAGEKEVTVNYLVNDSITYKAYFTITVGEQVSADATLTGLKITSGPAKTEYLLNDALDITGMEVVATFSDGTAKILSYGGFASEEEAAAIDTYYYIDGFKMHVEKQQTVTVSYTYGDVTLTDTFVINVWAAEVSDDDTGITVQVAAGEYGVTGVTVADSENTYVADAVADVMEADTYKAYDISLILDDGYSLTAGEKSVTLPIPDGVSNPVVYYVSDDGKTVEKMEVTGTTDDTVTFTTTHFSTYVVGESTEITVPDGTTVKVEGSSSSEQTVYVLTTTITSGEKYLIVDANSGTGNALLNSSNSVGNTTVDIASGSLTIDGTTSTQTYIILDNSNAVWTAGTNDDEWTFLNGSYYLYHSDGNLSLSTSTSKNNWSWNSSSNYLYYTSGKTTRYLQYSSGWTLSTSTDNVYLFREETATVSTSVSGTYSIAGNPAEVTKVVSANDTTTLDYTITFTPDSGTAYEVEDTDLNGTVTWSEVDGGDPKGVITSIDSSTGEVTFSGTTGKAVVKVSYTWTDDDGTFYTIDNYVTITASEPYYTLDVTKGDTVVTGTTITQKSVTSTTTLQLGTKITYTTDKDTETLASLPTGATLEWNIPEEYQNIATIDENGLITFKGVSGAFYVTAILTINGKSYQVGVNISATTSSYSVPTDGTIDFPEYPNEGAIRYDKTATAVGNFSETGIAQVELSMTGVPYTTGSEIDVVIMLDMTGSMSDTAMTAAEESAIAFAKQIVKNEDGTYNENRICIMAFNSSSSSPFTYWALGTVDSDDGWSSLCKAVRAASENQISGGTPYDEALSKCQEVLAAAKTDGTGNDRQQFCVFVSDGGPTSYEYITNYDKVKAGTEDEYKTSSASATGGSNQSDSNFATIATYTHEYYSTLMKDDGVTMFSVLTGLSADDYPNCATILENIASSSDNAYVVENGTDTSALTGALSDIAQKIMQAATDVTVEDKITDEYTMIFDIPTGSREITGVTNDFYIEFLKYTLDSTTHERVDSDGDGDTTDDATSVVKLYLKNTGGVLSAASDSSGTAYASPVFEQTTIGDKGTLYYWSTNESDGDSGVSVTVDGTTYYFVSYGMETAGYNMTSGAYAYGTVNSTNTSTNLVIATPYFVYNAATKMLYWTVDRLENATTEYALRYFLYLDSSATEVGTEKELDAGTYATNDHAYITYTNFKGNECQQTFPVPQLTWNGAQVSYVFYLVNAAGQPINKAGQVVDFANATFITDVYTTAVVWNKGEDGQIVGDSNLSVDWLADNLLPDAYELYDENAGYELQVYADSTGESIFNYFTIEGDTAANISSFLNTRLDLETTESTVSTVTTKVYNTKAGTKYSTYGTYTSKATDDIDDETVLTDFDFSNSTVAFAVVWQPRLVEDTVVVDFGLDVLINVVKNDNLQNTVSGISDSSTGYGDTAMNTGVVTDSKFGTETLTIDGSTVKIENENQIRFSQNDMTFSEPAVFYYESPVEFYQNSKKSEGYMYSQVTVIPATTVYYEDEYIDLTSYTKNAEGTFVENEKSGWTVGTAVSATQAQDRPGASQLFAEIDADNLYGYDAAYSECSQYSMGSAAQITVNANTRGEASFTFYGTGFDIIGLTSNTTGTLIVQVYAGTEASGTAVKTSVVDTYYGYSYSEENGWYVDANNPNALYQVPVMKISGLNYGQYTAKLIAGYNSAFDHVDDNSSYDLYLDAVRIYDPTGNLNETANEAYAADKEGWPTYFELRDQIISEKTFNSLENDTSVSGIVFIDGGIDVPAILDYTNYGPNNELYLTSGEAVAFDLNAAATNGSVASVQLALKTVGGASSVEVYGVENDTTVSCLDQEVETATDMYYDITDLNGKTVVIKNAGDSENTAIVSITNVKVTYTEKQPESDSSTETASVFSVRRSSVDAALATMSLAAETPETSEPETSEPEESEPEESEPETSEPEESEPEESEPETSEPEDSETEEEETETAETVINKIVSAVKNALSALFSKWFR